MKAFEVKWTHREQIEDGDLSDPILNREVVFVNGDGITAINKIKEKFFENRIDEVDDLENPEQKLNIFFHDFQLAEVKLLAEESE